MTETSTENDSYPYPTQAQVIGWVRVHHPDKLSIEDRALKLGEEAGEVLGAVVKIPEGRKTYDDLALELAQTVICCMGVAEVAGINLDAAIRGYAWAMGCTR